MIGVVIIGILGYYVPSIKRVNVLTPAQVMVVLVVLFIVTIIDLIIYRKTTIVGEVQWGKMTNRSQYALILLAVTYTSLMGLMGYARSGLREDWHVYGILRDTSPEVSPLLLEPPPISLLS